MQATPPPSRLKLSSGARRELPHGLRAIPSSYTDLASRLAQMPRENFRGNKGSAPDFLLLVEVKKESEPLLGPPVERLE